MIVIKYDSDIKIWDIRYCSQLRRINVKFENYRIPFLFIEDSDVHFWGRWCYNNIKDHFYKWIFAFICLFFNGKFWNCSSFSERKIVLSEFKGFTALPTPLQTNVAISLLTAEIISFFFYSSDSLIFKSIKFSSDKHFLHFCSNYMGLQRKILRLVNSVNRFNLTLLQRVRNITVAKTRLDRIRLISHNTLDMPLLSCLSPHLLFLDTVPGSPQTNAAQNCLAFTLSLHPIVVIETDRK